MASVFLACLFTMMRAASSPALLGTPHRRVWPPTAPTILLAAIAILNDCNSNWFVAWNGAALFWRPRWAAAEGDFARREA